jgi:hypothetical protein
MSRGYEIYKRLNYGYFTWVADESTRAEALERVKSLNRDSVDGSTYVAIAKAVPSLRVICPTHSLVGTLADAPASHLVEVA